MRCISGLLCLLLSTIAPAVFADTPQDQANKAMISGEYHTVMKIAQSLAEKDTAWAQFLMGQLYDNGLGVEKNPQTSLSWTEKAADNGSGDAQLFLGIKYLKTLDADTEDAPEKHKTASHFLNAAAEKDPKLRRQIFYMGKAAYMKGRYKHAFVMADAAANHGESDAQFLVGVMFDKGQGVPMYQEEAVYWYEKAAKQGHAMAQLYLAIKFDHGDGVSKNSEKSFKYYLQAATRDMTQAMVRVGEMYGSGTGVKKNNAYSLEWLKKAANKNSPAAMKQLALKYINGEGVEKSRYNAADWYYRAGQTFFRQGNKERALAAIESIESIVPNHFLSKRLLTEIYNTDSVPSDSNSHTVNAKKGKTVYGTAWPISTNHVVTAYHVLEGRRKITLSRPNGQEMNAQLVIFDHANDLAVLKVEHTLIPLTLSPQAIELGNDVFTIGYPEPDLLGKQAKYTTGKINSLFGFRDDPRFLQISTPILSGNSGGPLFDDNGQVVGVIISQLNAMRMFETTGDIPQNVNYAIKLPYLKALINMLPHSPIEPIASSPKQANSSNMIKYLSKSVLTVMAE